MKIRQDTTDSRIHPTVLLMLRDFRRRYFGSDFDSREET